jgi:hypothetical protein
VALVLSRTVVLQRPQSIAFDAIPDQPFGSGPLALTATATSALPVTFTASGACAVSGHSLTLSGTGPCTVVASQAGNGQFLAAEPVSRSFGIVHSWSGVLAPVNHGGSSVFKLGSTVPVKFRLIDGSAPITTLQAQIYVTKISDGVLGTEAEAVSTAAVDTGNIFRYSSGEYIFNLSTKSMGQGTWQIRIDLLDRVIRTETISLKK